MEGENIIDRDESNIINTSFTVDKVETLIQH